MALAALKRVLLDILSNGGGARARIPVNFAPERGRGRLDRLGGGSPPPLRRDPSLLPRSSFAGARFHAALLRASARSMHGRTKVGWEWVQRAVLLLGWAVLLTLLAAPEIGLHALWNVLIPAAPLLFVIAPGFWRNVCPLGSSALLPRKAGWSMGRRPSSRARGILVVGGLVLLLVLVPLRHVALDTSGAASAVVLLGLGIIATGLGVIWDWKSGWCSGMCPVHVVEKLYGTRPAVTVTNGHCTRCVGCVGTCPDSTRGMRPPVARRGVERAVGRIVTGGFVGFVWGWFRVPDYAADEGWSHLASAYGWPLGAMAVSLAAYLGLSSFLERSKQDVLDRGFAAAALCCYYWFRLPALVGYAPFPGDGMLVDLRGRIPPEALLAARALTSAWVLWWLLLRAAPKRSWSHRPPVAGTPLLVPASPARTAREAK